MYDFNLPLKIIMLILQYVAIRNGSSKFLFCMDNKAVRHCGIITSIHGNHVRVKCTRMSACSTCNAEQTCHKAKGKPFYVDVTDSNAADRKIGEHVMIEMAASNGHYAVIMGFVLPLVAFVTTLLAAKWCDYSDAISALCSLAVCVSYYALLFLLKKTLNKKFVFKISDTDIS